jgi:hypothetical protein
MDSREALRDVETIRAVTAGLSRKRDAVYVALALIYRTGHKWIKSGQARVLRDSVIELLEARIDPRARRKIFRFLIEIGWPALDRKLRSRYANSLRYAAFKKCPIAELASFLKSRGGIEKCANRYVAQRKSIRSKRTVGDQPSRE